MDEKYFLDINDTVYQVCSDVGKIQLEKQTNKIEYTSKENNTPLTDVDLLSNEMITSKLSEISEGFTIISEEENNEKLSDENFWLVDPLDGTSNYIKNGSNFCINVAFIKDKHPVYGAIYVPSTNDFYYGISKLGSYHVSANKESVRMTCSFNQSKPTIYTSSSMNPKKLEIINKNFINANINKMSSAIKFCYIASGNGVFYPRLGPTHEWDTASGQCIVEEAGGYVLDKNLERFSYNKNDKFLNEEFFVLSDKFKGYDNIIKLLC